MNHGRIAPDVVCKYDAESLDRGDGSGKSDLNVGNGLGERLAAELLVWSKGEPRNEIGTGQRRERRRRHDLLYATPSTEGVDVIADSFDGRKLVRYYDRGRTGH